MPRDVARRPRGVCAGLCDLDIVPQAATRDQGARVPEHVSERDQKCGRAGCRARTEQE